MLHRPVVLSLVLSLCGALTLNGLQSIVPGAAGAAESKQTAGPMPAKPAKGSKEQKSESPRAGGSWNGPPVLDPSKYFGAAAMGYASAKAAPEVMAQLFCYCGCDVTDTHQHLIDCFTSTHGIDCHICQEEAVHALKLHRDGVPMTEIQKQIDEQFAHNYPFNEDSANFKKYKASRLYTPGAAQPQGSTGVAPAGPMPLPEGKADCVVDPSQQKSGGQTVKDGKSKKKLKVKPGFKVGNCCGEESGHK